MKRPFLLIGWAIFFAACASERGGGVRIGYGSASRIARDPDIPGRNVPGQCLPFACALQARLQAAGVRSRIIEYNYELSPVPVGDLSGLPPRDSHNPLCHAVVAYQEEGRTYIIDNQSWTPTWVREAAPVEMAQRFSGLAVNVLGARTLFPSDDQRPASTAGRRKVSRERLSPIAPSRERTAVAANNTVHFAGDHGAQDPLSH
jgi:hypothetical protein